MASKWATEKAREMLRLRFIRHDEANTYPDAMVFNATVPRFDPTPDFEQLEEFLAAALDAARQEGKREMREACANFVEYDDATNLNIVPARNIAAAIRALPLEDR